MGAWADSTLKLFAWCGRSLCRWMENLSWTHCCCTIQCTFFWCRPVFQNVNSTGCSSVESAEFVFVLAAVSGWAGGKNTGIASEWMKTSWRKRLRRLLCICFISACVHPRCLLLFVFFGSQEVWFSGRCAELIFLHHNMPTTKLHLRLIQYVCFVTKLQAPPFPRDIDYALSFWPWTPACLSHPPQVVLRSQEKTPAANHHGCSHTSLCAWASGVKEILCSPWTREVLSIVWKQECNYTSRYLLRREKELNSRQTRAGRDLNRVRRNTDELCAHCAKPLHKMHKIINEKCVFVVQAQDHHNHEIITITQPKVTFYRYLNCFTVSLCFLSYEPV